MLIGKGLSLKVLTKPWKGEKISTSFEVLRPGAMPRFRRDGNGGVVGTVSEPTWASAGAAPSAQPPLQRVQ